MNPEPQHQFSYSVRENYVNPATGEIYKTPMQLMLRSIVERSNERNEKYCIHVLNSTPFFNIRRPKHPAFLGSFSWNSTAIKTKWIAEPYARNIGAEKPVTPGDIARDYLAIKFPNRRIRMTTAQYDQCVKNIPDTPLYCKPGYVGEAIYFDLDAAYWQIIRAVGWDCNYLPGEYLAGGAEVTDFPFRFEKMARNCLVSIGAATGTVNFWTGSELRFVKKRNPFINLILWRLVCDVLNGVAADVKRAGAVYIYTDGYIVARDRAAAVGEAIEAWGLRFSMRHEGADSEVRASGSYKIGTYQSHPYRDSARIAATDKIYNPKSGFLRWRFKRFVERADQDWLFWKGNEGYE